MPSAWVTWLRPKAMTVTQVAARGNGPRRRSLTTTPRRATRRISRRASTASSGARWWISSEECATSTAPSSRGRARTSASITSTLATRANRARATASTSGLTSAATVCQPRRAKAIGMSPAPVPTSRIRAELPLPISRSIARMLASVPPGSRFIRARSARFASTSDLDSRPDSSSSAASVRAPSASRRRMPMAIFSGAPRRGEAIFGAARGIRNARLYAVAGATYTERR